MAITLPSTLRAAALSHTAKQTSMLQRMPRRKAVGMSRCALPSAFDRRRLDTMPSSTPE